MEEDQSLNKPYRAEYAKSSRSNCKACKTQIAKDVLRLGVMVQSPVHDGKIPNWYHFMCFFGKQRPSSVNDIAHFDSLRWEDQQKLTETLAEASKKGPPVTGKGKKATKRGQLNGLQDYTVEYAKSSRAMCRGCEVKITKEEVRISKKDFESEGAKMYGGQDRWHHVECFAKLRNELQFFESGDALPGFEQLKKEDKETVLKALPKIEAQSTAKVKDEVDGAPPEKKIKSEKKEIKTETLSVDENLLKKQNKLMFKYRDQLKNLSKKELTDLLVYNNQDDPVGTDRKLDRLQDIMAFGALEKCTKCKDGRFIYQSGIGYQCNGNLTEWTKCLNVEEKPKRKKFKVPEEYLNKYLFLEQYKCKVQDRYFVKDERPKVDQNSAEPSSSAKIEKFTPFRGMTFFIIGKLEKNKDQIKTQILKWGGKLASKLTNDVVAIISTEDEVSKMNSKMEAAKELNIPVVPESFIEACEKGGAVEKITESVISPWGGDVKGKVDEAIQKSAADRKKSGKSGSRFEKSASKVTLKVVGGLAVDPDSGLDDIAHVYTDGKDKYTCVLGLSDVQTNKNSFYKIQLLESNKKDKFWVFRSWGRIGTKIGGKKVETMGTLHDAKKQFKCVYRDQTNNEWKNRENFVKYPEFMYPIDIDYGESDNIKLSSESNYESKLSKPLQELIRMIFDVDIMRKVMMEFELDMEKMPLGKLSRKQIQKAYAVLSELQEKDGDIKPMKVTDATNRFYTLIPHNFGTDSPPLLDNKEIIQSKLEMLESLMEMEVAYSLLRETKGEGEEGMHPLDAHYAKLNADIQVLERDTEEFKNIEAYVKNTHGETHTQYNLEIADVFKVKRSGEDKKFKPFKKMKNRKLLWHGSRITNFAGILSQGLRIAPPEAPVCGYMFGKGIYFADMVSKSANYCMTSPSNPEGLILLCEVALGEMYERTRADYIEKLPSGKHSTKGAGMTMPDPSQSIQNSEGVEIPLGKPVKQFDDNSKTTLLYNEYIVYDVAQVKMQYLIKMKFNYVTMY